MERRAEILKNTFAPTTEINILQLYLLRCTVHCAPRDPRGPHIGPREQHVDRYPAWFYPNLYIEVSLNISQNK